MSGSKIRMDLLPQTIKLRSEYVVLHLQLLNLETIARDRKEIEEIFKKIHSQLNELEKDFIKLHHGF